jgi:hypothetical protein
MQESQNLSVSTYTEESIAPEVAEDAAEELTNMNSDVIPSNWNTVGSKKLNEATDKIVQNLTVTGKEYLTNKDENSRTSLQRAIRLTYLAFQTKQFALRLLKKNIVGVATTALVKLPISEQNNELISGIADIFSHAISVSPELYQLVEGDTKLFNKLSGIMFECISQGFSKPAFSCLKALNRMSMQGPTLLIRVTKHPKYASQTFINFLLEEMNKFELKSDLDAVDVFVHLMDTFVTDPGTTKLVETFQRSNLATRFVSLVDKYEEEQDEVDPLKVSAVIDILGGMIELAKANLFVTQEQLVMLLSKTIGSQEQDIRESGVALADAIAEYEKDEKVLRQVIAQSNAIELVLTHVTTDLNDVNISSQFLVRVSELLDTLLVEKTHAFLATALSALLEDKDIASNINQEEAEVARSIIKLINVSFVKLGDGFVKRFAETLFNAILVLMCIDKGSQIRSLLVVAWDKMLKTVSDTSNV